MGFGSTRKLSSGRWQARYTFRGVPCKAPETFKTRALAQGWLNAEEKLITFDEWTPPEERALAEQAERQRLSLTVGAWLVQYHDTLKVRASTRQTYVRTVRNRITEPLAPGDSEPDLTRLGGIPLAELSKTDVFRWWDAVNRAYPDTPETNAKAYQRLKSACAEALRRELIARNPVDIPAAKRRHRAKIPYLPTTEELHAVVAAMPERYQLLAVLTLFHGLRIGEAIALEHDDVIVTGTVPYAPRWSIRVRQNAQRITPDDGGTFMLLQPPKSQAGYREVPFMPSLLPYLWRHLAGHAPAGNVVVRWSEELGERARPARLLTVTNRGGLVMDTSFRSVLARAVERSGACGDIRPHSGRRWLVTRLAEQGAHVKEISRILGDDDLEVIMRIYMLVRAERTTELMDVVSSLVGE